MTGQPQPQERLTCPRLSAPDCSLIFCLGNVWTCPCTDNVQQDAVIVAQVQVYCAATCLAVDVVLLVKVEVEEKQAADQVADQ